MIRVPKRLPKKNNAFSLIEVLIFVSVLSLFFVAAAAVSTASLRNMKINEHKILATRYAEELIEWLRSEKEIDWGGNIGGGATFTEIASKEGSPTSYCFSVSPIDSWGDKVAPPPNPPAQCSEIPTTMLKRSVTFTYTPVSGYIGQVNVQVVVAWREINNDYSVEQNTVFSVWE